MNLATEHLTQLTSKAAIMCQRTQLTAVVEFKVIQGHGFSHYSIFDNYTVTLRRQHEHALTDSGILGLFPVQ